MQSILKTTFCKLQIALDGDKFRSVEAEGATKAAQGSKTLLSYMVLPDTEKTFLLKADVTDFELGSITAGALPMNMDVDSFDTSELTDKVSELQEGIQALDKGVGTSRKPRASWTRAHLHSAREHKNWGAAFPRSP